MACFCTYDSIFLFVVRLFGCSLLEEARCLAAMFTGATHTQAGRTDNALAKARGSTGLARAALAQ